MKLNKIENGIKKTELECNVNEITLLSIEECERYKSLIPRIDASWWLRSPGDNSRLAAYVFGSGAVDVYGRIVDFENICIRPALRLNMSDSAKLQPGNKVQLFDLEWTVLDVAEDQIYVLADDIISKHIFDTKSNVWETSELKAWLEGWIERQTLKDQQSDEQKGKNNQTPKLYAYENSNGDKGIIIADDLSKAEELYSAQYPERKICKSGEDYWDNGAYLFEVGDVKDNKLFCVFPW